MWLPILGSLITAQASKITLRSQKGEWCLLPHTSLRLIYVAPVFCFFVATYGKNGPHAPELWRLGQGAITFEPHPIQHLL